MKIELTRSNSETFPSQTKILPVSQPSPLAILPPGNKENWFIHYQDRHQQHSKSQLIFLMIEPLYATTIFYSIL